MQALLWVVTCLFEIKYTIVTQLWLGLSLFMVIILILNRTDVLKKAIIDNTALKNRVTFIVLFSLIGILGTFWGIPVPGGTGIINTRAVGVIVGGLIGGPVVGTFTGIIVGIHRIFFYHTFTSVSSGIIAMAEGIAAGLLSAQVKKRKHMWPWALLTGFVFEALHMMLLFGFENPFEMVYELVIQIAPAMLITNPLAIALFIGILEDTYKREEKIASDATKNSFKIIKLTTNLLKNGFNEKTAEVLTSAIINTVTNFTWVALFYNNTLVTFKSKGNEQSQEMNGAVKQVVNFVQDNAIKDIYHKDPYIILPIYNNAILLGHLIVGKEQKQLLTKFDIDLALGLRDLISLQIEINEYKEQSKLLANAEIKALQAQINPHFLFNALNTIGFHCRSNPMIAKKLISSLADYYRHNLSNSETMITFDQEMEHVMAYVDIEMARFGDRLCVEYDSSIEYKFRIPPLIMQPIVENAIKHGILPKTTKGNVVIKVRQKQKCYVIFVIDNGVGIDRERLNNLLVEGQGRQSIGLINVHKRLVSIYGINNGLHINSIKNKGTIVSFKIPREGEEK